MPNVVPMCFSSKVKRLGSSAAASHTTRAKSIVSPSRETFQAEHNGYEPDGEGGGPGRAAGVRRLGPAAGAGPEGGEVPDRREGDSEELHRDDPRHEDQV